MTNAEWQLARSVLRLGTQLIDGIQAGMAERGFDDVRPVHGFVFTVVAESSVTTVELAETLGVSKQAAAQLVDHLVTAGYVRREPDPRDGRARRLVITARGRRCTEAATQSAAEVVRDWERRLPARGFAAFERSVRALAGEGRLRPGW